MWLYGICWIPKDMAINHKICDAQFEIKYDNGEIAKLCVPVEMSRDSESIKMAIDNLKKIGKDKYNLVENDGKGLISWGSYYEAIKNINKDIKFYTTKDEYGYMSNFYRSKQIVDGKEYITNEHWYQSQKAVDPVIREWIRLSPTPHGAMMAGRSLRKKEVYPEWDKIKFDVMKKGIYLKFSQNEEIRNKLLSTGDVNIHEDSPTDMVWGIKGQDMLGKILMEVREELRGNKT
jgi:ribA/ribD-fused uncharacterized protein